MPANSYWPFRVNFQVKVTELLEENPSAEDNVGAVQILIKYKKQNKVAAKQKSELQSRSIQFSIKQLDLRFGEKVAHELRVERAAVEV